MPRSPKFGALEDVDTFYRFSFLALSRVIAYECVGPENLSIQTFG